MDLKLLRHLSDAALQGEAKKRGLPIEGDRTALIEAIQAHARSAPPSEPPPARSFGVEEPTEPIRTRTMADLLASQGHLERAERIYRELAAQSPHDLELRTKLADLEARTAGKKLDRKAQSYLQTLDGSGIAILSERDHRAIAWCIDALGRERAESLIGAGTPLVRVVRITVQPHRGVETRTEDYPVDVRGVLRVPSTTGSRLVVSVGLKSERGFASIASART
jgi:hypothetical protein